MSNQLTTPRATRFEQSWIDQSTFKFLTQELEDKSALLMKSQDISPANGRSNNYYNYHMYKNNFQAKG